MSSRVSNTEEQPRIAHSSDVPAIIGLYRAYIFSLARPIIEKALLTPSSLWIRGLLLPIFAFYISYQPHSLVPWVVALATLASVPVIVAVFIYLRLYIIIRKGTENELSEKLPEYYSESGSRFFVISAAARIVGCVGVRNRTGGQAELTYFAVRQKLANSAELADALLATVVSHARKADFVDLIIKLNSAEAELLAAVKRAGFGKDQLTRINAWFHSHRLQLYLKKHR
ncbi:hypothetical protein Vretimale_3849 [Volvox reticuliferus]|uniref:N-acetyltransferase domain-containing protein n=1 Tax=Volvox reticuliferus TaxID=1737510 RepID=A0A8J4G4V6_9CHLO|nr:hypothetical protein Vretifemale_1474 [Volvox reticuliferus]GIL98489.1 hypothetical protein Vretimale_3849 [Volvox reticuliferus]